MEEGRKRMMDDGKARDLDGTREKIENDGENDSVQPADGLTWLPAFHNSPDLRRLQRLFS